MKVFENGARNCDQDTIAKAVGYSNAKNGAYKSLQVAAKQFGLVEYQGSRNISVKEEWINAFHSENSIELKKARRDSIQQPSLYRQIIEEYKERQLPSLDKLARELHLNPQYGILPDVAETAAKIFLESAKYAGIINSNGYIILNTDFSQEKNPIKFDNNFYSQNENLASQNSQDDEIERSVNKGEVGFQNKVSYLGNDISPGEGLEKYEITLINQEKAYIYVPVPLPSGEKDRLKKYIDLIIEESSSNLISSHVPKQNDDSESV